MVAQTRIRAYSKNIYFNNGYKSQEIVERHDRPRHEVMEKRKENVVPDNKPNDPFLIL